ncbi:MAG: hypothetical protein ACJAZO_002312 [Myxococcota bacterium]|jgi:hypothetical protein
MSSETAPVAKPRAGWVNALIGVVIGLALGMTIGTAGAVKLWYDANYLLETTQAQHMTALAAKDAERAEVQAQYDTLQKKAAGMNARIAVSRAVDQLDQRNFGTAQAEIERARELLGQSLPAVSEAGNGLETLDLRVAVDAGAQRALLIGIGNRLDVANAGQ